MMSWTDCQEGLDEALGYLHLALEPTPHTNLQTEHVSLQRLQFPGVDVAFLELLPPSQLYATTQPTSVATDGSPSRRCQA